MQGEEINMKKSISKLLLTAILLSLVSCSDESLPSDSANDKPSDSDQTTETLPTGESSAMFRIFCKCPAV